MRGTSRRVWVAAAVAALAAALVPPAHAALTLESGRFTSVCDFSHESRNDPIVLPRRPGLSHLHHFFGNRSTDDRSTARKLRRRPATTCSRDDRSAYWVPALKINDRVIEPSSLRAYYSSSGRKPATVQAPPRGLKAIAGLGTATTPQPSYITSWMCAAGPVTAVVVAEPHCPDGETLVLAVNFPDCWNGATLDSEDHQSHLAYADPPNLFETYFSCPPTHPVPITALRLRIVYPTSGSPSGVELSSGGIYSGHADFMNGWKQRELEAIVADCIRKAVRCTA